MTVAVRLDGVALAERIRAELAREISRAAQTGLRPPALTVVLVGDDPASEVYVRNKTRACDAAGLRGVTQRLPADVSALRLERTVADLNADPGIDGVLVQLPLPRHLDPSLVRGWVDPSKDVDGLHPYNVGLLAQGNPRFVPCTPAGCMELLRAYGIPLAGRHAVVVGRSAIVGRPMSLLLAAPGVDATVTVCHSRTRDLAAVCRTAEVLVVAAGIPQLVTADFVAPGAAVIDVGIHRLPAGPGEDGRKRLVGDVDPDVAQRAAYLSPVPGGVGPMTIAMLLRNTVQAWRSRTAE